MSDEVIRDPRRLSALQRYNLLDTPPEDAFDQLTRVAAQLLDAPVALVSLIDSERQFFKSCFNRPGEVSITDREGPLSHSFCKYVVGSGEPLVIEDARVHPLVKDSPAIPDVGVVAYAGVPLTDNSGFVLGTLCVFDVKPRQWGAEHVEILQSLASAAMSAIVFRAASHSAPTQRDESSTSSDSLLAAEQLARSLLAHLKALDDYQNCISLADPSEPGLRLEAECQRSVEDSHQELAASLENLGQVLHLSRGQTSGLGIQAELHVAVQTYLDAKRRRTEVLTRFQELRAALGEVERAAMDTRAAEHALRTLSIAILTKNE